MAVCFHIDGPLEMMILTHKINYLYPSDVSEHTDSLGSGTKWLSFVVYDEMPWKQLDGQTRNTHSSPTQDEL